MTKRMAKLKILIADDSAVMRQCIRQTLSEVHEIVECKNGREAVRLNAVEQADWVLLDIQMPELDGLSAAREIKEKYPQVRIIFVTAHNEKRFRAAAAQLGARGYVLKEHLEEINQIVGAAPTDSRNSL
jgi:DNA-binding NarL/FixJ family response regulator